MLDPGLSIGLFPVRQGYNPCHLNGQQYDSTDYYAVGFEVCI